MYFSGRKSGSRSPLAPNTNHYLASLIKGRCSRAMMKTVFFFLPPRVRTTQLFPPPVRARTRASCMFVSRLISRRFSSRCSTSSCSLINALTAQEGNSIFRKCLSKIPLPRSDCQLDAHVRKRKHHVPAPSQFQIQLWPSPEWEAWPPAFYVVFFSPSDRHLVDGCDRNTQQLQSATQHPCTKSSKECPSSQTPVVSGVHNGSLSHHTGAE